MKESFIPPALLEFLSNLDPYILIAAFALLVALKAIRMAERAMEQAFKTIKKLAKHS